MQRDIEKNLLSWKNQPEHLPLLLRGTRQVGKTFIVEQFATRHFEQAITINFELQPEMAACFQTLQPTEIIRAIELISQKTVTPGQTLLFLDEIQECPQAIRALRYFKEKMPQLHVIGAGSLLEFSLKAADYRMPVGRVQSFYLKPFSFKEYLLASGNAKLRELIEQVDDGKAIPDPIHQRLLQLLREYMALGGMPAVLNHYFQHQDLHQCQQIQTGLLHTYRLDFGQYAKVTDHKFLRRLFEKIPILIGEHFKYVKVDPDMRSRDIKNALELLIQAGLIYPVYASACTALPLESLKNEKKFRVLFVDGGLVVRSGRLDLELLFKEDLLLANRGMLAEQYVGQELLASQPCFEESSLHFWCREKRSSMAEVDFVIAVGRHIIPIEVKAGTTGRLKSLKIFMDEKQCGLGIHVSQAPFSLSDHILSVPLYMVSEISRLAQYYL